jgi:hypothetical protein
MRWRVGVKMREHMVGGDLLDLAALGAAPRHGD